MITNIFHLSLSVFLHYLLKIENYSFCQFQWHIACKTSELILELNLDNSGLNLLTIKS